MGNFVQSSPLYSFVYDKHLVFLMIVKISNGTYFYYFMMIGDVIVRM